MASNKGLVLYTLAAFLVVGTANASGAAEITQENHAIITKGKNSFIKFVRIMNLNLNLKMKMKMASQDFNVKKKKAARMYLYYYLTFKFFFLALHFVKVGSLVSLRSNYKFPSTQKRK